MSQGEPKSNSVNGEGSALFILSWKVRTSFEDSMICIKLLPLFPTRLEFRLVKMKREFGF